MHSYLISFVLIALQLFCVSCKKSEPVPQKKESTQVLKLYLQGEPISLDPRIGGTRSCQVFLRQLFEGLTRIGIDGRPVLAAAKNVDISKDGCSYTFSIRKSFWSNGEPVTAHDFEYAWKSVLTPNFPSSYSYAFSLIKGARRAKLGEISLDEVAIRAIDSNTLVVELEHPAPYFLELVANPLYSPVCKKTAIAHPSWSKNGGSTFVSNGPFVLSHWTHHTDMTLRKNFFYRDAAAVKMDAIQVALIDDPQTALHLFEKNEIDIYGEPFGTMPSEAVHTCLQQGTLKTKQVGGLYWFEVNTTHPLLASAKIRRALAMGVNRKELTDHLLQGGEKPAFSILPESLTLIPTPLFNDHDIAAAQLLFEEGLQELAVTKDSIPSLVITHWSDPREKAIACAVQQQWKQAFGIHVELVSCDWSSFFKKINTSDYQIAGCSWYTWYQDPIYNMEFMKYKSSGLNGTGWEHPRYIAQLDLADHATNSSDRQDALRNAEELIVQEMPIIPLFSQTYKYLKNERLQGFFLTPVGQLELKGAYFE